MTSFPTSKIELHQWFNSLLLLVVGFFASQTYFTIARDHERIAEHETRITVLEKTKQDKQISVAGIIDAILPKGIKVEEE